MFELIGLGVAAGAGIWGHMKSRKFVRRKLRFTKFVEKPGIGIATGIAAAVVASPIIGILTAIPLLGAVVGTVVGTGTALAFGAGVGTGVSMGAKDAKRPLLEDD